MFGLMFITLSCACIYTYIYMYIVCMCVIFVISCVHQFIIDKAISLCVAINTKFVQKKNKNKNKNKINKQIKGNLKF